MNETVLTWIVFILAFGGMVLIHEFGHFIVARLCGIEVEEFGIGLPTPGAVKLFTWKGTRFTLNWLPLGGFVRPKGENDPNVPGGLAAASPWKRLAVLFAGPLMNLLAAVIIYSIIFNRVGVPDTTKVLIASVVKESSAAAAGFQDGDILVSGNVQAISNYDELREIIDSNVDKPINFVVNRNGEEIKLVATPHLNPTENRAMIGVGLGVPFKQRASIGETLGLGIQYTGYSVRALISLPAQLLRGTVSPEQGRIIGLKGIYDVLQQSVSHDVEASNNNNSSNTPATPTTTNPVDQPVRTLELLASLTISLGVFNLFPFPALDGGRIIFILPELIFRRRVSPQVENFVHGMGMAFLLLFMLYVNVMDFINPANINIP
ncbi:MAG TPA: M50 family metallopeptidase [Anaerolineales bacterium]|nr:M50 family metallopeptidase [Anaerolineales bacterium]